MDFQIRDAKETDIAAITGIYAHHVLHGTGSFETEPPASDEMERRRLDVVSRGLPYLVAEAGFEPAIPRTRDYEPDLFPRRAGLLSEKLAICGAI